MPSDYTPSLRLILPVTGELDGTWGDAVNEGLTELVDNAIAGRVTVAHNDSANYTLTVNDGVTDEARYMVLNITGTLTAARNVVCPAVSKLFVVENNTSGGFAITFKTSAGTGVIVPAGQRAFVLCDGTNVVSAINVLGGNLAFTGTGNRITGDFSNATHASRVLAQTSTTNGNTSIGAVPNGTATATAWNAYGASDVNNAPFTQIGHNGTQGFITATRAGSGAFTPLIFQTSDVTRMQISTAGNVGVGTTPTSDRFTVNGAITTAEGSGGFLALRETDPTRQNQLRAGADASGSYLNATFATGGSPVLRFQTANVEHMQITASGNVGIGGPPNSTSARSLDIDGAAGGARLLVKATTATSTAGAFSIDPPNTRILLESSSTWPLAFAVNASVRAQISGTGDLEVINNGNKLGYGTGAGGTVTQATSKSTAVTLNRPTGQITMNAAALAAGASVEFIVNNSLCGINDSVIASYVDDFGTQYVAQATQVWNAYFAIRVTNVSAGSLSQAVRVNFAIIKGATS